MKEARIKTYNGLISELKQDWAKARIEEDPAEKRKAFEAYYVKYRIYLELKARMKKMEEVI